jgi:hypothetical protein
MPINFEMMGFADRLEVRDDYTYEMKGASTAVPMPEKEIVDKSGDTKFFDPEGSEYDMDSAKASGMKPIIDPEDGLPHYGSVIETTKEQQEQFGLPEESYMLLKGKTHETWDKAVQGEADRGFRIKKFGDRYFSIPAEINEEGKDVEINSMIIPNETIVKNWSANYQTTNNPEKEARATEVLKNFDASTMPKEAVNAVKKAVYIFEGDKGQTAESITQNLNAIGAIESNYTTKVQGGGGPARSYWQVEPTTAQDNLVNGSALLGKRFNEVFERYAKDGKTAIEYLKGLTLEEWSDVLEKDDELGAAMAAHKLLRTVK